MKWRWACVCILLCWAGPVSSRLLSGSSHAHVTSTHGRRQAERRQLIVGGQTAKRGQFPYMCSLRDRTGGQTSQHVCGATLIAPRLAVTAAYCVTPPNGVPDPVLWCGLYELYDEQPGNYDVLQTVKTVVRKDYQPTSFCNDVALLELNATAVHAQPIGGTLAPGESNFTEGQLFMAIGWGYAGGMGTSSFDPEHPLSNSLQYVELPVVPHNVCDATDAYNGHVVEPFMFCAGYLNGTADTCAGDSGGPLVDATAGSDPAVQRQVGIISWGAGCARPGWPGVYVRLDTYHGWVDTNGYCGCTSTGLSGSVDTGVAGCSAATLRAEQAAGLQPPVPSTSGQQQQQQGEQALCYVVDPERCSQAATSKLFRGAAVAPCDPQTNLTVPAAGQYFGKTEFHKAALPCCCP